MLWELIGMAALKELDRLVSDLADALGVLWDGPVGESADGADIASGSMAYPPCQCPRHRKSRTPARTPVERGLSARVAEINGRSGRGVW